MDNNRKLVIQELNSALLKLIETLLPLINNCFIKYSNIENMKIKPSTIHFYISVLIGKHQYKQHHA